MSLRRIRNPTPLQIGATGTWEGQRAEVRGWAALKSADGFRWDEYQVQLADRTRLILVYEAGVWKRFARFEPSPPLEPSAATATQVGSSATWDGIIFHVSYASTSRVMAVEGTMPAGYEVGIRDHYYNAENANEMVVVSWNASAVECYRGRKLRPGTVEGAFNLPRATLWSSLGHALASWVGVNASALIGFACVSALIALVIYCQSERTDLTRAPPPPLAAPVAVLGLSQHGSLAGHDYTVLSHREVNVDDPAGRFVRHEYDLVDEAGRRAVLIQSVDRDPRHWILLRPADLALTPYQAAALLPGSWIHTPLFDCVVRTLFRCQNLAIEGVDAPHEVPQQVRYGFVAQANGAVVVARWTAQNLEALRGMDVPEAQVVQAFGPLRGP